MSMYGRNIGNIFSNSNSNSNNGYNYNNNNNNSNNNNSNNNSSNNNSSNNSNNSYQGSYSNYNRAGNSDKLGSYRTDFRPSDEPPAYLTSIITIWKQVPPLTILAREEVLHLTSTQLRMEDYYLMRKKQISNLHDQKLREAIRKDAFNEELFQTNYNLLPFSKERPFDQATIKNIVNRTDANSSSNYNNNYNNSGSNNNSSSYGNSNNTNSSYNTRGNIFSNSSNNTSSNNNNRGSSSYGNSSSSNNIFTNNSSNNSSNVFNRNSSNSSYGNSNNNSYGNSNNNSYGNNSNNNNSASNIFGNSSNNNGNASNNIFNTRSNSNSNSNSNNVFNNSSNNNNGSLNTSNNIFNSSNSNSNSNRNILNNGNSGGNNIFNNNNNGRNIFNNNNNSNGNNIFNNTPNNNIFNNNNNGNNMFNNNNPNNNNNFQNLSMFDPRFLIDMQNYMKNVNEIVQKFNNNGSQELNQTSYSEPTNPIFSSSQNNYFDFYEAQRIFKKKKQQNTTYINGSDDIKYLSSRYSNQGQQEQYQEPIDSRASTKQGTQLKSNIIHSTKTNSILHSNQPSRVGKSQLIGNQDTQNKIFTSKSLVYHNNIAQNESVNLRNEPNFVADLEINDPCECQIRLSIAWETEYKNSSLPSQFFFNIKLQNVHIDNKEWKDNLIQRLKQVKPIIRSDAVLLKATGRKIENHVEIEGILKQRVFNLDHGNFGFERIQGEFVYGLLVYNDYGSVTWEGPIDLTSLDLHGSKLEIDKNEIFVCENSPLDCKCRVKFNELPARIVDIRNKEGDKVAKQKLSSRVSKLSNGNFRLIGMDGESWEMQVIKFN